MALYYVSDLHLRSPVEPRAELLVSLLDKKISPGDTFVFGGDIFDLFVGKKEYFRNRFSNILSAIERAASRGIKIFYLEGNHDFLLDGVFSDDANIFLYADDFSLNWLGKKIWVCHGDQINREDYGYLALRAVTRNILFRIFLFLIPGFLVSRIGNWSSGTSRKYTGLEGANEKRKLATKNLFREYAQEKIISGFDAVLIGHSHIEDRISLEIRGGKAEYINLGYAEPALRFLCWNTPENVWEVKHLTK